MAAAHNLELAGSSLIEELFDKGKSLAIKKKRLAKT